LSHVVCLITLTRDVETKDILLAQEDKKTLDNYVKNERKRRHNSKKNTNTFASTSPQACSTTTPLLESTSMLPTTSSHIPLSLEIVDKQPDLHHFNQGMHFYYKIQLQLQIIRTIL